MEGNAHCAVKGGAEQESEGVEDVCVYKYKFWCQYVALF